MGDIMDEINALLGESENENEESTPTSEREETGGTNPPERSESQTEETESETEEQQEEVETEESGDDESEESVEESDADPRDAKIAELQAEINRLAGEVPEESKAETSEETSNEFDPVGEHDFDEIVESKDSFTKWAKDFGEKIRQQTLNEATKGIDEVVKQQVAVHRVVDKFYNDNPDLENHRDYVGKVAKDVAKNNPEYTYDQVFNDAAKQAREKLGLPEPSEGGDEKSTKTKTKPAFADSGKKASAKKKAAKAEDNLTETEKQIQELLEV